MSKHDPKAEDFDALLQELREEGPSSSLRETIRNIVREEYADLVASEVDALRVRLLDGLLTVIRLEAQRNPEVFRQAAAACDPAEIEREVERMRAHLDPKP